MPSFVTGPSKCVGYQQVTNVSAVTSLTVPTLNGIKAKRALIQAEAQGVRWRNDGTDPTTAVGMIITANSILDFTGDLEALEFIEDAAGAILNVAYFI